MHHGAGSIPKRPFPSLHAIGCPSGSWIAALLGAAAGRPNGAQSAETNLVDALRLSAMAIGAKALSLETSGSTTGKMNITLPDSPSPLLVIISDESDIPDDSRESLIAKIEAACRDNVSIYRLPHAALSPSFARRVFDRWGVPGIDDREHRRRCLFIDHPGAGRTGPGFLSRIPSRVSRSREARSSKII